MTPQPDGTPPPVLLRPLHAEVVAADHAAEVVVTGGGRGVGGDGVGGDGARGDGARGDGVGGRGSFLDALPQDDADDASLRRSRAHLDGLRTSGRFRPVGQPFLGVLVLGPATDTRVVGDGPPRATPTGSPQPRPPGSDRTQLPSPAVDSAQPPRTVAIVGDLDVAAYTDRRVLPHEQVDDARVDELARYLDVVGSASSPVCITHRPNPDVTAATTAVLAHPPAVRMHTAGGARLSLHLVTDPTTQRWLSDAVANVGQLYLADGHHRAAAVARCETGRRHEEVRVLTAVVPTDHLRVDAFHRRIDGPRAVDADDVRSLLRSLGLDPTSLPGAVEPDGPGIVHSVVDGGWWRIDLRGRRAPGPVPELDVTLVDRELLDPLRRLMGPGGSVTASPAPQGLDVLDVPDSIGLALHPPGIDEVLGAADRGSALPPKTTYLSPKLPSGLIVVPRA